MQDDNRLITRPQGLLRAFFGLGPSQATLQESAVMVYDLERLMRSVQDCQVLIGSSGAIIPGDAGSVAVVMPRAGTWLIHAVSLESAGPATSGSVRMWASAQLDAGNWGVAASFSIFDKIDSLPRPGAAGTLRIGKWFDEPIILHRSRGGAIDQILGELFNDAASVGNASISCRVLARQTETVVS